MTARKTTPLLYAHGSEHTHWKGANASYGAFHIWINRWFPKTGRCEYCGGTRLRTDYASASHERYTRNRADWFELCRPCHMKFDGKIGPRGPSGPRVTHCPREHEYTPENTYLNPSGGRYCRTCHREAAAVARQRRREIFA